MARFIGLAVLFAAASAAGPCCKECKLPLIKYYSVDRAHGFCGDACMDPKKFSIYKKFEANLTLVDADHPDCSGQYTPDGKFYTDYDSTVTHGDPFGILAVTLDLYAPTGMPDHSCCSTPIVAPVVGPINCKGKPKNMTIRGTGPYCCPATATEEKPCKPKVKTLPNFQPKVKTLPNFQPKVEEAMWPCADAQCNCPCYYDEACKGNKKGCTECKLLHPSDPYSQCVPPSHLNADNKPSVADAANANASNPTGVSPAAASLII